jgi:hypothetical protein
MAFLQFDINEWTSKFALPQTLSHRSKRPYISAGPITSPSHVCVNEQLRAAIHKYFDWGRPSAADVFIMAEGEPEVPYVTKVAGVPYRPSNAPWPTDSTGSPLTFVGQLCFCDSMDIAGPLPGDVLLMFCEEMEILDGVHFEWWPLGIGELIASNDVPVQRYRIAPCHGYVYRTANYPEAEPIESWDVSDDIPMPGYVARHCGWLPKYQATQITRSPFLMQFEEDAQAIRGQVIGVFNTVGPVMDGPYPWVNHAEPLFSLTSKGSDDQFLIFGDGGCVYVSLDESGITRYHESC